MDKTWCFTAENVLKNIITFSVGREYTGFEKRL